MPFYNNYQLQATSLQQFYLKNCKNYVMKRQQTLFLQNREVIKKLKQSWEILHELRNQCNKLESQLDSNPYQSLEEGKRRLTAKKNKLEKQIVLLKRDIDCDDNATDEQEDKIKEIYELHKQLEQKKAINLQKQKELEIMKNKIGLNCQVSEDSVRKFDQISRKFKSIEVSLGNSKLNEKHQMLKQKRDKIIKLNLKRIAIKQEEYSKKIKDLQGCGQRINQLENKQKQTQREIDMLVDVTKELRQKTRLRTRIKTERATTETSVEYNNSTKKIYKRYSSLQPSKDSNEINEFLQPWESSHNISMEKEKQFEIRQLHKRKMGQKIRVCLNN